MREGSAVWNNAVLSNFPDRNTVSDWAKSSTAQLLYYGIVSGSDGYINPSANSTRAQAILLAKRVIESEQVPTNGIVISYPVINDMDYYLTFSGLAGNNGSVFGRNTYIFGNAERYATEEESSSHMVSVKIPVWKMKESGEKYSSTATVQVHEKLEHIVYTIFQETYDDPQQFPIKDVGGFNWRENSSSEHNWGLAIDINYDENPQVIDDEVKVGIAYEPGVNPYSCPADGIVVQTVKKYGFFWGGDAWGEYNHDYMHFLYLGR